VCQLNGHNFTSADKKAVAKTVKVGTLAVIGVVVKDKSVQICLYRIAKLEKAHNTSGCNAILTSVYSVGTTCKDE
jgi:hypothetical protein